MSQPPPNRLPAPAVAHVIDAVLLPVDLGLAGSAAAAADLKPVEQGTKASGASSSALASVAALAASLLAAAVLA